MLKSKKLLALLFAVVMLIQTLPITGFAADVEGFVDFPIGSWSEEAMTAAVDNGLLVGTSETTIEPRKNLTRAEFAAIVTRAFGATEKADISKFEDVDADMWYAEPIAKVVQMGVMNGTGDTTFAPNSYMKREDVILALARVLFVNGDDTSVLDQFSDKAKIDNWSVKAIAGMVSEGYVHGYEDGTIRPLNYITREELAQLFHNIFKTYISEDGEFDSVAKKGSVIVRSKYVTLKDVTIDGDLIMADGIGDGDFRISNVHVTGKIIARGGEGMNYFVNVTADGKVIVNDPNGVVNFYNYREEDTPFKGGNVIENTPATFLERKTPTSPSIGGGGGADYDFYIYDSYESITNNLDPEVKLENKGASYKIKDSDVPTEIDGKKVAGWYKEGDIEFYDRSDLVGKKIKDVEGKWYPAYLYTINFVTDSGTTSVEKIENKAIEAAEIPVITTDVSKEFKGWSTTAGSLVPEYTDADLVAGTVKDVFGDETEVTLYPVIVDKDAVIVVFKHPAGDVEVTKYDPDYVLTDSDIPADPTKADHTFKGWSKDPAATTGEDRSYFVGKKISAVEGTWYPVFEENLDEYTITFVTDAGNEVVTKTEGETIADSEIPAITVDASKEFMGWTTVAGSTNVDYTNAQITADVVENVFTSTSVTLYPVIKDKDSYSVIFKPANAGETDKEVKKYDPDYVLTDSDVPADPTKADHVFAGWAKDPAATTGEDRSYFVGKKISEVEGTWYPIFTRDETTYSVSFKYEDGTEALPTVEKSLVASEDYVLTNADVKDVAHPTAPADYKFLGWSEAGSTVVVPSADLEKSIRDLDGKIYYAQFEKVTDNYTVVFKYTDGTEINKVEKTLSASENYVLTSADVDDVDYHTNPADYTFLGWTETISGTDYKTSAELQVSIKDLDGKTFYAQFERAETTYSVSFKYEDGTEALPTVEKSLVASEDYVLTNADVKDVAHPTAPADYKFLGWSEAGSTVVVPSADLEKSIRDLDGKIYYAQFEKVTDNYTVVFKYTDGTEINKVEKTLSASENYVLTSADVDDVDYHTNPADYTFLGWTETISGTDYKTSAELQVSIKDLDGKTFYAQFERAETTYSVSFKYEDGTEALPTVEKSLVASEDYVLTNADVKDVAHPTAPADYKFLGWSEAGSTVVVPSADLEKSIRDLDGKIYYAQFEKISDVYTIIFKDNDENDLATLTKNEDESIVDSEIPAVSVDASSLFKGWATTKGATTVEFDNTMLVSDVVANVFTSTTVTLYPVIVPKDAVEYFIEHYFEDLDGNYVLDSAKTQNGFEIPGKTVTATALTVEHYEENLTHADRLAEGIVPDAPEVLTLKFFYDLEVLKVNYYDLAVDEDYPVLVYDVKYGGTIDNFCYEDTAFDAADNDAIKAEIKEYVEYIKMAGYGKNYDDEYFFTEFDDTMGSYYYPGFGAYDHQHEINFKWYVEDAVEEYVVFDEAHVFTEDLDLFSKVKKLNAVVEFPSKLTDEVLTLNIPYEEHTRFLDSVRDALYINDHVAEFPEMAGVEDDMYDKLSDVGGRVFGDDGIFNDEYEINNTDVMIYFYQMMGGKAEYRRWLWNEVESSLRDTLGRGSKVEDDYMILRNTLPNDEIALKTFFEDNYYGLDFVSLYSVAYNKYIDSRNFINDSSEKDEFLVTANNEFIMEKVDEKIRSLASLDAVIDEYGGGRVPEGLLNRLPMDIVKDIYEPRVQRFLDDLDAARDEAKKASPDLEKCKVDSGIIFDINLVEELLIPGMEFAEESHTKAVNKAVASGNKAAELIEKYYVDNPYVTGAAGNYGAVNYAFEPSFYVEDTDGDGLYTIKSFYDIYTGMVMPEAVESVDALLWYMDPEGGAVEFSKIRNLAEENEALILALHNHPHALMAEYAENGLPETMEEYWEDLLSDPEIKKAVEKIDNKVSFDMMYFVEDKINNATLEMYFLKVLNKVGVPAESLLSKYTGSKAYKELTSEDFNKLLDQLEECWETVDVDGEMVENANGTTDYVFDNVLDKVGSSGDVAEVSIKGFAMTITRFFADDLYQVAP